MSSTQSTQKNVVGKTEQTTTTITVGGTGTTIQVTGTKVTIPASFNCPLKTETVNKAQKNGVDATTKDADTKAKPYYSGLYRAYYGDSRHHDEDDDFEDISERGAEEYGA